MEILIAYVVGSLIGAIISYRAGVRGGADATLILLAENNYIRTKLVDGETQIVPLDQE